MFLFESYILAENLLKFFLSFSLAESQTCGIMTNAAMPPTPANINKI